MTKLKILVVHFLFSPYGGGEVVAYNTYKLLKDHGHDVYFFAIDKKPYFEEDYEYAKYFYKAPEKERGFLAYLKRIPSAYYNKNVAIQFEKLLDKINPDIVHVHTVYGLTYSIFKPCFDRNIPVIKTEHSADILCPTESLLYQNKTYCTKHLCTNGNYLHCIANKCKKNSFYESLCCSVSHFVNDITGYNKKIAKFITPSSALKKIVAKKGICENKIEVISNFFDNKFIDIIPNYTNKGYFLYSGRLYNFKGVETLMNAILKLPQNIEFHIAGTGSMENWMKDFCKNNDLTNVKFLGFMKQEDLIEEYQNCIALIIPSIWFEIFGLVAIEAMACGKPVIASNIGALGDIIENNKTGLLFEPGNIDELAAKILYLYQNPEKNTEMGHVARETAIKNYTEETYYNNLIELYNRIIKTSN